MTRRLVQVALATLYLAVFAVPSFGQVFTGRIDVTAKDSTGAVLPGVTVELTGVETRRAVTDSQGQVHFLSLAPGRYTVSATLSGFNAYKNDNVPVGAGSVVELAAAMTVGGVTQQINVTADTPMIEAKRQTVSTNVSLDELQNIPSSRDPWVVLQTVPGVVVDRVNVGGAESGQQSNYQAKGAGTKDNTWNMDGIAITDMAALGASPTYYDFDMFQEMQVTTGGADPANPTPGVQLNFVLRSGTNAFRGSGRYYFENDAMQADNVSSDLKGQILSFNRVNSYFDTGLEGGGPIVKNRVFGWGAYGQTEPKMRIFGWNAAAGEYRQTGIDETILKNISAKVSAEINQATRFSYTFFNGNKEKFGRGASATRPDETTWDQTGPMYLNKFEINRTMGSNVFVTARYAYSTNGFSLTPRGGVDGPSAYRDLGNVWHGNYYFYETNRPQHNINVEGNYFKGNHELKAGFGWRKAEVTSSLSWPGGQQSLARTTAPGAMRAVVVRPWNLAGDGGYWSGFVGDTMSMNRLTLNFGVRWDRAATSVGAASVPQNNLSDLLPALDGPAKSNVVVWNSLTPRLGLTYALDEKRKTLLRASYAMFASQLDSNFGASVASAIPYYSYVYYNALDLNGNSRVDWNPATCGAPPAQGAPARQPTAGCEYTSLAFVYGFDPANPLAGSNNHIGDYKTPLTHELIFGADHELMQNFAISASLTWRKYNNFNWLQATGVTGADYTQAGILTGTASTVGSFSVPFYAVNSAAVADDLSKTYDFRDGYTQKFLGFEVSATKRMSNRWMMRASWSGGAHREYFDSVAAMSDPTPAIPGTSQFSLTSPNKDGGIVIRQTTGSGKSGIFMALPKYQFVAAGLYQFGWGLSTGVNYLGRQGYSMPFYRGDEPDTADDLSAEKDVLIVSNVDDFRLPMVHSLDWRLSKEVTHKRFAVNFDLDAFNLFNASTTLGRQFDNNATNFDRVLEITNPRIFRVGVRVAFK